MANYSELIATINEQIKANGNQEITGPVLNAVLRAMVSVLGENTYYTIDVDTLIKGSPSSDDIDEAIGGFTYLKGAITVGAPFFGRSASGGNSTVAIAQVKQLDENEVRVVMLNTGTVDGSNELVPIIKKITNSAGQLSLSTEAPTSFIGPLSSLNTNEKGSVVGAINEVNTGLKSTVKPYVVDLTDLLAAQDSESISTAIGGIDNLNGTVQKNQVIFGTLANGTVAVGIRVLGNQTTLTYFVDSVVGLTVNEVIITNTSGTLTKTANTHAVLTENMVVNNLKSDETTLPLSAAQGKTLKNLIEEKQNTLTPGTGIEITDDNIINVTLDTTVFKAVPSLPDSPAAGDENKIHLVPAESTEEGNIYTEYVFVNGKWEEFGTYRSEVDLTLYLKTSDAEATYQKITDNTLTTTAKTVVGAINEVNANADDINDTLSALIPALESSLYYGIEYDITVSSPDCLRIGNPDLHRRLPIHSMIKGCLLNDNGDVVKYLNPDTWLSEIRDGSQGQVMVELPMYYRKFETDGNKRRVKISEYPLPGYHQVKKKYVSAYEATVQRSTTTLCSVVNEDADYRGGNNNAEWDGTYRSLLGRPATSISRTNFRTYARKRKSSTKEWNCMTYDIHKDLFWLFIIEYATLNSQKAFNASKDSNGYAQGGLGDGVTNLYSSKWSAFNGYYPFVPCGYTDELGNGTGEVEFSMPEEYDSAGLTVKVARYRGIENPFGHLWQWTDGINVRISPTTENGGDGLSKVFVTDNPEYFNDSNYNNMSHVGNEARAEGYVKSVIFGEGGEIMPDVVGGGSTTYFCDYHYTNMPTSEALRGVLFGGDANNEAYAGFGYAGSHFAPSHLAANVGSRLCFIPA